MRVGLNLGAGLKPSNRILFGRISPEITPSHSSLRALQVSDDVNSIDLSNITQITLQDSRGSIITIAEASFSPLEYMRRLDLSSNEYEKRERAREY